MSDTSLKNEELVTKITQIIVGQLSVDPEKVKFFIEAVQSFSRTYHLDNNI